MYIHIFRTLQMYGYYPLIQDNRFTLRSILNRPTLEPLFPIVNAGFRLKEKPERVFVCFYVLFCTNVCHIMLGKYYASVVE